MAQRAENSTKFQKTAHHFRVNAALIIEKMLELSRKTGNTELVKEILHSILFLGKINSPPLTPAMILRDRENEVRELYPEIFQGRSLPRQSPFSCVLDMIVCRFGENNEGEIKTRLQEFILCVCLCPCNEPTNEQKISQEVFIRNAMKITDAVWERRLETKPVLVNQILLSVFFLGHKKNPRCTPEMILGEKNAVVRGHYPEPFQRYKTKEPIPCVLNTIHHLIGQRSDEEITGGVQKLIGKLKESTYRKFFLSSTVCVSQVETKNSVRYYGVSMSTFPGKDGSKAREIMIAASCLDPWHKHVAGAVMTYLPNNDEKKTYKYENIDGTIKLPVSVKCEAFSLTDGVQMSACKSCAALFSLQPTDERHYPYGNCAEVESLSKMLINENQITAELNAPESWIGNEAARDKIQLYLNEMLDNLTGMRDSTANK